MWIFGVGGGPGAGGAVSRGSFTSQAATNATATMASSGLASRVEVGKNYGIYAVLLFSNTVAADGVKVDFSTSGCTSNKFRVHATVLDTALLLSTQVTALTTDIAAATITGPTIMRIEGGIMPTASGDLDIAFAMQAVTTGVLTLQLGSFLMVWEITPPA